MLLNLCLLQLLSLLLLVIQWRMLPLVLPEATRQTLMRQLLLQVQLLQLLLLPLLLLQVPPVQRLLLLLQVPLLLLFLLRLLLQHLA